jgi:hypothetical protein
MERMLDQHGKYPQNTAEHKLVVEIAAAESRQTVANIEECR